MKLGIIVAYHQEVCRDYCWNVYLQGQGQRCQNVQINGSSSTSRVLSYGVPQGSMVGPFTFPQYSSPLAKIAAKYGLSIHLYADDTQLYLSFDVSEGEVCREKMEACLDEIRTWMAENMLKLNESKT